MVDRRVVITGLGIVTPAGATPDGFFDSLAKGRRLTRRIDRFDSSRYPSNHAGFVEGQDAGERFSRRLLKKLDRFSGLSLLAADSALADASIDMGTEARENVGIILGNALGGWGFAETELRDLYTGGLRDVSPYQATAWFPAAPQGQISIYYGIKGFSKTIISDIASSHLAVGYAARAIRTGRADIVLAGGAEAPISPYALLCCNTSGELSVTGNYRPFDMTRDGYVIGEGAGILVMEEYARAKARGARIYAEVSGFGHTSDGVDPVHPDTTGAGMARAMRIALDAAGLDANAVDCLMPAGAGVKRFDESEANALGDVFGSRLEEGMAVSIPKSMFGNLLGASGAVDIATACFSMQRDEFPAWTGCETPAPGWEWASGGDGMVKRIIDTAVVNSIGRGGVNASIVLRNIR
jgi:3-oxoacyl-[acyl-carrier-protein] synthase II